MKIRVYGPGCAKCVQTEELVRKVVAETGADVQVEKITDMKEIVMAGILSTPAVAVDGQVKVNGRVPTPEEVRAWVAG